MNYQSFGYDLLNDNQPTTCKPISTNIATVSTALR